MGELVYWILGAMLALVLVGWFLWWKPVDHGVFGNFGQGAAGLLSVIALAVAAGIYFFERGNKPKVVLQPPVGTVTPLGSPEDKGQRAALLHLAMTVENRSSSTLLVQCAALDLIKVDVSGARNPKYFEDLPGESLLSPPAGKPLFDACLAKFERPRQIRERKAIREQIESGKAVNAMRPSEEARTGTRFTDFSMEPGEMVTKTWDQRVQCSVEAVQVIFKVPKPGDTSDYESKSLIPVAAACRAAAGERG